MKIGTSFLCLTMAVILISFAALALFGGWGAIVVNHSPGDVSDGWRLVRFGALAFILSAVFALLSRKLAKVQK